MKTSFAAILSLFSSMAFAQNDPCSSFADLTSKSNPNAFIGFGVGTTQKQADDNAQIDLASRIRQKVTATSTVTENNDSSHLDASSSSVISESSIGAKVLRRCPNKDSFSTVVSLDKSLFMNSLEKKLSYNVTKAQKLLDAIRKAANDEVGAQNIDMAKKFIADYQTSFESDLELCKTYGGCASIKNEHVFSDLADIMAKEGDKNQYLMVTNTDDVTESFRDELVNLAQKEGVKIMDGVVSDNTSSIKRKIYAECKAKVGSKIPGTFDRVVETTCTLEAYIGKQKSFRKVYSCKAMANADISTEDAVNTCSGRLQ